MGIILQITQIVHNDILVKEIKSAHDHLRCKYDNSNDEKNAKEETESFFFPNEEGSGVSGPNEGAVPKLSGNSLSANFVLPGSHLQMKGYIYSSTGP